MGSNENRPKDKYYLEPPKKSFSTFSNTQPVTSPSGE